MTDRRSFLGWVGLPGGLRQLFQRWMCEVNPALGRFLSGGVMVDSLQTTSDSRTSVFISNKLLFLLSQCKSFSINNLQPRRQFGLGSKRWGSRGDLRFRMTETLRRPCSKTTGHFLVGRAESSWMRWSPSVVSRPKTNMQQWTIANHLIKSSHQQSERCLNCLLTQDVPWTTG